jgi:histidyl-tRNA synthetase
MAGKNKLISARLPRGFEDRGAAEIGAIEAMIGKVKAVYERYGFDPVETPLFEYTEALGKFLPDTDRPNAGVFSLQDDDEQWLSLRYDLTAPLARHFAENFDRLPKPYRTYRAGYVFRNEKPGPGRYRQFLQLDADTVGAPGPEADAEMAMMMADTMDALGLAGKYVVKVNNRKVLDGVLESAGVTNEGQKLAVLRAVDKLDRLGQAGVRDLLRDGRRDESGDFTEGAGLGKEQAEKVLVFALLQSGDFVELEPVSSDAEGALGFSSASERRDFRESNKGVVDGLMTHFGNNEVARSGIEALRTISELSAAAGYDRKRIRIDPSVVRGLEYYTGPVFEIELTFPVTNERGEEVVFGSVGGGGRYDGLVSRFRSEPVPATGFSIGVSRLATALRLTGNLGAAELLGPVVVLVMDRDQTPRYQEMVSRLRNAGIRAEMFLGATKNLGKQLAYADRRNAPAVVIEGGDERARGVLQVKDLAAGKAASAMIADNAEWKAERPGQFECPNGELVARIRDIVAARTGTGRP